MGFSIIVPTCGRPTLAATLASIASQIASGDEVIVICDTGSKWGNSSRDKAMEMSTGTHLLFMDDDDVYAEGALDLARKAVADWPEHVHVFRMHSPGDNNPWCKQEIAPGQVGTPMVVWPAIGPFPRWDADDTGVSDFRFIDAAAKGKPIIWHEEVLAIVRPS
jgi:glycosyltransferase involved in cell wall biosynthesis